MYKRVVNKDTKKVSLALNVPACCINAPVIATVSNIGKDCFRVYIGGLSVFLNSTFIEKTVDGEDPNIQVKVNDVAVNFLMPDGSVNPAVHEHTDVISSTVAQIEW